MFQIQVKTNIDREWLDFSEPFVNEILAEKATIRFSKKFPKTFEAWRLVQVLFIINKEGELIEC